MTDRPTSAPQPVAWWVPVTERLPEKNTEVLICFEGQNTLCSTGQYTGSAKDVQGWCYPWENRGATDDGDDPVVTHWMPLPAPPGEEPPLYDQAALDAVRAEERERWSERDDIHTESSRIYARLAGAVRAGADDASLARLLRHEVSSRSNPSTHTATPQEPT